MAQMLREGVAVVALLLIGVACSSARNERSTETAPPGTPAPVTPTEESVVIKPSCLERFEVDHGASVLSEQRRVGPHSFDFQSRFAAEYIDPDAQVPVEVVKAYQIGKTPLLWFNAGKTEAVVNAAVLSELTVADITRLNAGASVEIGRLTELGVGKIAPRELVKFLIYARVIATYVHIGSELCLVDERDDDAGYQARFTGEHTYFTNEKNVDRFAFAVQIDPAGVITVLAQDL